jgi:hypothetical protein
MPFTERTGKAGNLLDIICLMGGRLLVQTSLGRLFSANQVKVTEN